MVHELWLPDVQAGFRKGRGTRDQIAVCWIIKKAREFQKNISFCFIDYTKAFDCVDHKKLWNILKDIGIPEHLTCLLRNLYAGQEGTVRTGHGTDWFLIEKGVSQGCILSPCLFNLYAEYLMRNAGLDEEQVGIKTEISITPDKQMTLKGCCWTIKCRDSWTPEETNSIRDQRRGWITQSFCVIKFY